MAFEKEVQDFMAEGTELPESKLTTGFVAGERPPANWFNNLFYKMTQAVKELQTKSAEKEYVDSTIEEKITEFSESVAVTVDAELSETSENPVQNKVITEELNGKATKTMYTATIPATGWTDTAPYFVNVPCSGIYENDTPIVTPIYESSLEANQARKEDWNKIDRIVTANGGLRAYAFEEIPTVEIPINIQVIR